LVRKNNYDWINSPIATTTIGAIVSGALSYYFGLKRDKRVTNLEEGNKKLKLKQEKDNKEIRAETKELLKELEKRVRLELEKKITNTLYSIKERKVDDLEKENKKLENEVWQLKYLLSWHGLEQEEVNTIIDGDLWVIDWLKKPKIIKKEKEITDKRFNCKCKS